MEKNKEKKEMKISLWTFYVLIASVIVLLAATISGWSLVAKQNKKISTLPENPPAIEQQK